MDIYNINLDTTTPYFYALLLLALAWFIQMGFYWGVFSKLAFYKAAPLSEAHKLPPVSVIICAKNEYLNLKKFIPLILNQRYHNFEVLIVDDGSDDDTSYLLKDMKEIHPNLTVVDFKKNVNFFSGKKFPLALGIKSAKHDVLVLTDADCFPKSDLWLQKIAAHYANESTEIVLAYSPYEAEKGFLNSLIRFDAFFVAVQYLSFALSSLPYMGVGRNLSYRRQIFVKNKGFSSHYHIMSGDDDLFINQVIRKSNYCVEINADSHMVSLPKKNFTEWLKQKKRHFTTYPMYKPLVKYLLGTFSASNFAFYALLVFLLAVNYNIPIVIALFILKFLTKVIIIKNCSKKLSEKKILLSSLIFEFFLTFLYPIIGMINVISKKKKWN